MILGILDDFVVWLWFSGLRGRIWFGLLILCSIVCVCLLYTCLAVVLVCRFELVVVLVVELLLMRVVVISLTVWFR